MKKYFCSIVLWREPNQWRSLFLPPAQGKTVHVDWHALKPLPPEPFLLLYFIQGIQILRKEGIKFHNFLSLAFSIGLFSLSSFFRESLFSVEFLFWKRFLLCLFSVFLTFCFWLPCTPFHPY